MTMSSKARPEYIFVSFQAVLQRISKYAQWQIYGMYFYRNITMIIRDTNMIYVFFNVLLLFRAKLYLTLAGIYNALRISNFNIA